MPFTLAHPAAVLPLRRACPRWLSFPALVVGALAPDLGYLLERFNGDRVTHQFLWIQLVGVPVGLLLLWGLQRLGPVLLRLLPPGHREPCASLLKRPRGSPLAIVVSLALGIGTHLAWDAFTHKDGWLVMNLPPLQIHLLSWGSRRLRVFHLLSYASTVGGVVWLSLAYQRWVQSVSGIRRPALANLGRALLVGALMLPIALAHHLVVFTFFYPLVMLCALWVAIRFILPAPPALGGLPPIEPARS